jgi:putative aminopeptidase FrvX
MPIPDIDREYLVDFLTGLLNTPSPTGLAEPGIAFTETALSAFPDLRVARTRKGALLATWPVQGLPPARALTAHVDTLGAMVKEIKPNGRLKLSQIGGYAWNTVEGESCTIYTSDGRRIRGSILIEIASTHVHREMTDTPRKDANMEVRLDAHTSSAAETSALGIQVGDFISLDPRVEVVNGFIRSRHLDDKASVACIVAALKALRDAGLAPAVTTCILFSNYEEVGHGASTGIPPEVSELLAVDMAAIGQGQTSDEYHASICVKDSGGPYHHGLSQRLRRLGIANGIDFRVDIYPFYGSDGEAWWRAGADAAVALIGPGVDASHNYERTHMDALVDTTRWILAYLLDTATP